jgi:hypothetical protein
LSDNRDRLQSFNPRLAKTTRWDAKVKPRNPKEEEKQNILKNVVAA